MSFKRQSHFIQPSCLLSFYPEVFDTQTCHLFFQYLRFSLKQATKNLKKEQAWRTPWNNNNNAFQYLFCTMIVSPASFANEFTYHPTTNWVTSWPQMGWQPIWQLSTGRYTLDGLQVWEGTKEPLWVAVDQRLDRLQKRDTKWMALPWPQ